jgi:hypothetical protein
MLMVAEMQRLERRRSILQSEFTLPFSSADMDGHCDASSFPMQLLPEFR